MKFYFQAEVNAKSAEGICNLVRTFFKNFYPESCITVKGKHAVVKFTFDEQHLPTEIVEALTACEDENLTFSYGNVPNLDEEEPRQDKVELKCDDNKSQEDGETIQEDDSKPQEDGETSQEDDSKPQGRQRKFSARESFPNKPKARRTKEVPQEMISKLKQIADEASSYQEFKQTVCKECFKLTRNSLELFLKSIDVAENMCHEEVNWPSLENALIKVGVDYSNSKRISLDQMLKRNGIEGSSANLIKSITKYKMYDFSKSAKMDSTSAKVINTSPVRVTPEVDVTKPNKSNEETNHKFVTPGFEERFRNLDQKKPIEKRVAYVLCMMDLDKVGNINERYKNFIIEISISAVKSKKINISEIMAKLGIIDNEIMEVRRNFSNFIKAFIRKYDKLKNVTLPEFLTDLQKVILTDSEYKEITGTGKE